MHIHLILCVLLSTLIFGCAGARKKTVLPDQCGATPIQARDLEQFGFQYDPQKIIVVRMFRGSCPFCKEDLAKIGELYRNGTWDKAKVQLALIAYYKEGVENRKRFDQFVREQFARFEIPIEATQIVYLNKSYYDLVEIRNAAGKPIFEGWTAVPYGMVFGSDGRLAERGHFTSSKTLWDAHYNLVSRLQKETCPPTASLP